MSVTIPQLLCPHPSTNSWPALKRSSLNSLIPLGVSQSVLAYFHLLIELSGLREAAKEKEGGQAVKRASFSSNFTQVDDGAKGVQKTNTPDLSSQGTGHVKSDEDPTTLREKILALLNTSTIYDEDVRGSL